MEEASDCDETDDWLGLFLHAVRERAAGRSLPHQLSMRSPSVVANEHGPLGRAWAFQGRVLT